MRAMERLRLTGARRLGFRGRTVDGIHVLELDGTGDRPPVLLVHGLASCGLDYVPLMTQLAKRHRRVIAPDLPGHGFSPAPLDGMSPRAIRDRLTPAFQQILDEPAIVLGNSLGGLVAIRAALHEPEKVLGLVLASPGGAPMSEDELEQLLSNFRLNSHQLALGFVDRFQGRSQARHVFAWGARLRMKRENIRAFVEQISHEHLLTAEELAAVQVPTLVFWGTDDRVLPASSLAFFREHLPHANFVEPPGYGHAPYLDHLKRFVVVVDGFVERQLLAA